MRLINIELNYIDSQNYYRLHSERAEPIFLSATSFFPNSEEYDVSNLMLRQFDRHPTIVEIMIR